MSQIVIPIKTFTCTYSAKEDRLLLTMNYQEINERVDFWLTRSFLLKLLPIFFDLTTEQLPPQASPASSNTSTDASTYVLTQKAPMLLESVDFQKLTDNRHRIVFKNIENATSAEAFLEQVNLESFVQLLLNTTPKYEWGMYHI
ncbi:hypothetical protein SUSP_002581 [Sulfurospirillum sp. 'SP']|nr:hypothetical protein SUSP_002581 [Sulfurospirillum sp. 'SP']